MRWIIFITIYILIDVYAFQAFRSLIRQPVFNVMYIVLSVILLGLLIYALSFAERSKGFSTTSMYIFGFFLAFFVPKLLLVGVMLIEDIVRLLYGTGAFLAKGQSFHIPSRRKFIGGLALGLAAIPFVSLLYGMYKGKYRYRVLSYIMEFDDLPASFDGYRITQISDIHSGSFDNPEKISYGIDLINEQKSDVILFTGDLVNNVATEMDNWKEHFSKLTAADGVFSVLGNHDYGDYASWETETAKEQNLQQLKNIQAEMGWNLLLNEHRFIERNGDKIAVVGVENWGAGGFKKAGDIDKASAGLTENDFKVLMSHDPSYWQERLKADEKNYQLTLSGHTHGMQFGIEIPGFLRWSPVQYRYKNWAGIYEEFGRFINVNRGFGYLGYPGRVGIWPEVTVIELRKKA
ncbi:MAG: metallophosphoesterase [Leeuwenhoekiella sp.]